MAIHGSLSNTNKQMGGKGSNFGKIDSSNNLTDNYSTEQQIHGSKGGSGNTAHASPPPVSHYYQKMSTQESNQIRSQKQSMIQPPHFIKVKSKTNNPTRKNSPGINQRSVHGSMHQHQQMGSGGLMGTRGLRESNNSHIQH